jgi:hypothetical protein
LSRGAATLLAPALAVVLSGCGSDSGPTQASPSPCVTPTELAKAKLPTEFALEEYADITEVTQRPRSLTAEAITTTSIIELYPPLAHSVLDAGFEILASENEGFEAEIFFASKQRTGAYRLREGPCEGLVTIRLLYGKRTGS